MSSDCCSAAARLPAVASRCAASGFWLAAVGLVVFARGVFEVLGGAAAASTSAALPRRRYGGSVAIGCAFDAIAV